jgi:hypothetical protein
MPRLIQVKLLTLFLDIGFNTGVHYYHWLGSSRLFPTGWIIVITLAEWPSVIPYSIESLILEILNARKY